MITLRPLHTDEFPAFAAYFVPDYAAEIVANFGIPLARAPTQAAQDLDQLGKLVPTTVAAIRSVRRPVAGARLRVAPRTLG